MTTPQIPQFSSSCVLAPSLDCGVLYAVGAMSCKIALVLAFGLLFTVYPCTRVVRADNCCWCGKRYQAKEGYYEGSTTGDGLASSSKTAEVEREGTSSPSDVPKRHLAASFARIDNSNVFPFGMFVNWGDWLQLNASLLDLTVGNTIQPVSPFEPGDYDTVDTYLELCESKNIRWNMDLQHVYQDDETLREQGPAGESLLIPRQYTVGPRPRYHR
eukprot:1178311-Prorocentrum_minimum.AAC.3